MARLKLPDGTHSAGHGTYSFVADDAGIIDTLDAPPHVVDHIMRFAGAREATQADVEAADEATVAAEASTAVRETKGHIVAELSRLGVKFDGRATLKSLRKLLDEAEAQAEAAQQKQQQAAPPAKTADKPKDPPATETKQDPAEKTGT